MVPRLDQVRRLGVLSPEVESAHHSKEKEKEKDRQHTKDLCRILCDVDAVFIATCGSVIEAACGFQLMLSLRKRTRDLGC
jgi:hypothetical protein